MKVLIILTAFIMTLNTDTTAQTGFYDLQAENINGEIINFDTFKGKKVLIVNTASKCGFTGQYEGLQELHKEYGGDDFMIVGFPSNDFMNQEPGSEEDIKAFCEKNYGVEFLMMSKVKVKGKAKHPVYAWLTDKKLNNAMDSKVSWNFQKYMINENGELVDVAKPKVSPKSDKILNFIKS
ncbi:MAG: glutathione peroxidase [Bacteroidota bacterium]